MCGGCSCDVRVVVVVFGPISRRRATNALPLPPPPSAQLFFFVHGKGQNYLVIMF